MLRQSPTTTGADQQTLTRPVCSMNPQTGPPAALNQKLMFHRQANPPACPPTNENLATPCPNIPAQQPPAAPAPPAEQTFFITSFSKNDTLSKQSLFPPNQEQAKTSHFNPRSSPMIKPCLQACHSYSPPADRTYQYST